MIWATLASGKRIPLDAECGYRGRYVISQGQDGTVYASPPDRDRPNGGDRYRVHMATCQKMRRAG